MDEHEHDELYPLEQVEFTPEIARFKDMMRQVVLRTTGIHFDAVRTARGEQGVECQLWVLGTDKKLCMRWYGLPYALLHALDPEPLIDYTRRECEAIRDGRMDEIFTPTVYGTPPRGDDAQSDE